MTVATIKQIYWHWYCLHIPDDHSMVIPEINGGRLGQLYWWSSRLSVPNSQTLVVILVDFDKYSIHRIWDEQACLSQTLATILSGLEALLSYNHALVPGTRQHCRLDICSYFGRLWQIWDEHACLPGTNFFQSNISVTAVGLNYY